MRCGLTRIVRHAVPIVLILAAAPTTAFAQPVVCHAIGRGESATHVARRLTGDGWNAYKPWFQIMNASSRYIPKSQYNRVRAGWRACLIKSAMPRMPANAGNVIALDAPDVTHVAAVSETSDAARPPDLVQAPVVLAAAEDINVASDRSPSETSGFLRAINDLDLTMVWLGAAVAVPWFGWRILDDHLTRRRTTAIVMRHFADRFGHEFERPLIWYDNERPVRMRVRFSVQRGRMDILLAPGTGRRYPNLSDHKKNVEYDVARVVRTLADKSFVCGSLSTQAGWVVVPFRFKAGPKQSGVTCISSF